MPKNIVQDINPGKRSIRDISVPSRRKENVVPEYPKEYSGEYSRENKNKEIKDELRDSPTDNSGYTFDYDVDRPHKEKRWGLWALIGVFVLALIFGVVSLFARADITVVAKSETIPLQTTLNALKDQPAGQFGYQIVSVSKSIQKDVVAGEETNSNSKASGTIIVYNAGSTVQNLLINTRFETTAGLVFRATKAISVPKATTSNGATIPGSVSVAVLADKAGDAYNVAPSDFTLPGLKGGPQFKNVYGRSKNAMTGGFSGMMKTVDTATLNQAGIDMQNSLKTTLANEISSVMPISQNFILFPTSISYSFGAVSQQPNTTSGKTTLQLTGTASAIIFDKVLLSQKIISTVASSTDLASPANVQNLDSLKFTLTQPTTLSKDYTGQISFQLQGDAKIAWLFDQTALKNDLIGLKTSELKAVLAAKYPSIMDARAKIFPVWKQSFPSDPNKISISQVDSF